jgi:hypothetical protein
MIKTKAQNTQPIFKQPNRELLTPEALREPFTEQAKPMKKLKSF